MEYEYDEDAGTLVIDQYAVALLIMLSERFGMDVTPDDNTVATSQYWCEGRLPQLLSQVYESHQWESSEEASVWVEKVMARSIAPVVCVKVPGAGAVLANHDISEWSSQIPDNEGRDKCPNEELSHQRHGPRSPEETRWTGHNWIASRPIVEMDDISPDSDWEVSFPIRCRACGLTAHSEADASDGFINYDRP